VVRYANRPAQHRRRSRSSRPLRRGGPPTDGEVSVLRLRERVAGEVARGRREVAVGEAAEVLSDQRDLLELARGRGDCGAGSAECDHGATGAVGVTGAGFAVRPQVTARAAAVGVGVITALVLLTVEPGRVKTLAEELLEVDA